LTEEQFDQWVIPSHMISPEEYKPKSNVWKNPEYCRTN
jgi:hypothetical protein